MKEKIINWKPGDNRELGATCSRILRRGEVIVAPTKVGYIIIATNKAGLEKKFQLKGRSKNKPGVVLCNSVAQVRMLAQTDESIRRLYSNCINKNILIGCILPWKEGMAEKYIPNDGSIAFVQDNRKTSCFVVEFGIPSEQIVRYLWEKNIVLCFASSANPSGKGNKGCLLGVGDTILEGADLLIEADDYVRTQQSDKDTITRYEQGVMVSMVDDKGKLCDVPVVIRKGLSLERIMFELSRVYDLFDYRQGMYH